MDSPVTKFPVSRSFGSASPVTPPSRSNIIGDMSKPCALPLVEGKHENLLNISSTTLVDLMQGDFRDRVANYVVIDCRYPYEYEGGHILGAINLYDERLVESFYKSTYEDRGSLPGRNILVFYCEFSQHRSPIMMKYLRQLDRCQNLHRYPYLDFPEIYVLDGGYEQFYRDFDFICTPRGYIKMDDPRFDREFEKFWIKRKYLSKSKSKKRILGSGQGRMLTF